MLCGRDDNLEDEMSERRVGKVKKKCEEEGKEK